MRRAWDIVGTLSTLTLAVVTGAYVTGARVGEVICWVLLAVALVCAAVGTTSIRRADQRDRTR